MGLINGKLIPFGQLQGLLIENVIETYLFLWRLDCSQE